MDTFSLHGRSSTIDDDGQDDSGTRASASPAVGVAIMDTDSNDGTAADVVDGESKPDLVKLAQTAIIKQVSVTT